MNPLLTGTGFFISPGLSSLRGRFWKQKTNPKALWGGFASRNSVAKGITPIAIGVILTYIVKERVIL